MANSSPEREALEAFGGVHPVEQDRGRRAARPCARACTCRSSPMPIQASRRGGAPVHGRKFQIDIAAPATVVQPQGGQRRAQAPAVPIGRACSIRAISRRAEPPGLLYSRPRLGSCPKRIVGGCGDSRSIHATRQPPFRQPGSAELVQVRSTGSRGPCGGACPSARCRSRSSCRGARHSPSDGPEPSPIRPRSCIFMALPARPPSEGQPQPQWTRSSPTTKVKAAMVT